MLDDQRVWPAKGATEAVPVAARDLDLQEGRDGHSVIAQPSLICVSKQ
jgi:hypothetical protein